MEPNDYPTFSVSLAVSDAAAAIDYYRKAFGAKELYRLADPTNGKVGHAELTIDGARIMLADEYPEYNKSPSTLGGSPVRLTLKVADVDAAYQRAIGAGGIAVRGPADQFYGHRSACLTDPFGHEWMLFKELQKMEPAEMQRLWNEMTAESK